MKLFEFTLVSKTAFGTKTGNLNVLLKDGLSTSTAGDKTTIPSQPSSTRICDKVFGCKVVEGSEMTLINLGGVYPNQKLTIMIKGKDRAKFKGPPEKIFANKQICVTGTVIEYKGKPEIIVSDPSQIEIK